MTRQKGIPPLVAGIVFTLVLSSELAGQSSDFDKLLAQAKTELSAGQTDQALADSRKAIALQANRWDAHMIAGYALQSQKRYDEAIDEFTNALQYAPADKKADAKRFLEQCMAEKLTSSAGGTRPAGRAIGTPPTLNAPASINQAQPPAQGPTLEATMAFIQDKLNGQAPAQFAENTVLKAGGTVSLPGFPDITGYDAETHVESEGKADAQTCTVSWKETATNISKDTTPAVGRTKPTKQDAQLLHNQNSLNSVAEIWWAMDLKGFQTLDVAPLVLQVPNFATVTSSYWLLTIKTAGNSVTGRNQGHDGNNQPIYNTSTFTGGGAVIYFADKDLANRMGKAISYAAGLCNPVQLKTLDQSPF